jgi:Na+-transporting NADH:ubiquinone oxidoreductase subunit C
VALRPIQEANQKLDQQKNILDAAGLAIGEYGVTAGKLSKEQIDELYSQVSEKLVDLETGEYVTDQDPADWDLKAAASDPKTSVPIVDPEFDPGEATRQAVSKVYFIKRQGSDKIQQVVLPIHGKGLWGTLYGYMALRADLNTIQGLTFYEHKETPGLGGEVDNPAWKAQWEGLNLYNPAGEPAAMVYKGVAPAENAYAVDGLSGATITCNGVTKMLRYWASDDGYGKFLGKLGSEIGQTKAAGPTSDQSAVTGTVGAKDNG